MAEDDEKTKDWWGSYRVPVGQTRHWRIGPLHLWIQRLAGEWRLAWRNDEDHLDATLEIDQPVEVGEFLDLENASRYVFAGESGEIELGAALADRPVVTLSEKPLSVAPGEDAFVYVSSPLWICIDAGRPPTRLVEIPALRPSDTWFGHDTREGELCYASWTAHWLELDRVPFRPHRATTAVLVQNRARELLSLERMKLPVPLLSLFMTRDRRLWTQDVIFERSTEDDFAAVHLPDHDRVHAGEAERIATARQQVTESVVMRAFSSLFTQHEH